MRGSFANHRGRAAQVVLMTASLSLGPSLVSSSVQPARSPRCEPSGPLVHIAELPEASGIASSRRVPGRFWAHNDSGEPVLFALDIRGAVTGRLQLTGAKVEDWEAVAVGPCPAGSCISIGDIGDNGARRKRITVYRVTEPAAATASATVTGVFHATYPDGPHDAEALLVAPDGRLYIVTKGDTRPIAVYRFPNDPRPGSTVELERVGPARESRKPRGNDRVTDGAVSPDGAWVVLRDNRALTFYRAADLLTGNWREAGRVALKQLGEPQGEGVAFGANGTVYVTGEGGGRKRAGTFAQLTCSLGDENRDR